MKNVLLIKSLIIGIIVTFFVLCSLPASSNLRINKSIFEKANDNNLMEGITKKNFDELPSFVKFELNFYGNTYFFRSNPIGNNFTIGFFCFSVNLGKNPVANLTYWKLAGAKTSIYIPNIAIIWGVLAFTDTNLSMPMDPNGGYIKGWSTTLRYIYF